MTPEEEAIEGLKLAVGAGVFVLIIASLLVLW
jgi:hypothetical protein